MIGIESTEFFAQNNLQGEVNLHNLFRYRWLMALFALGVLFWVVVWPLFVVVLFMQNIAIPPRSEEIYEWFLGLLFALVSMQSIRGK